MCTALRLHANLKLLEKDHPVVVELVVQYSQLAHIREVEAAQQMGLSFY
ncbi:hypothetical protein HMPREF9136_1961 [Prevotella dentalis DSM 3688]|uniref:Uncharacterized protein n=1 Tax=Prevotella dentalis (strain ATCC 49559 / DSM 3688 / JCM 13448 / NCTC 12043 / ES 2772) TaxID=908937 RepID=F9D533_PREDD|nr:hypothetical protein HMPREF9136_1961 [Prevotella dentalis DSM 3688]